MGMGPYVYLAWFAAVAVSLAVAGMHIFRGGHSRLVRGLAAPAGALLSWALVSAYVGAFEAAGYTASPAFLVSLCVGLGGLGLLGWSCSGLRTRPPAPALREGNPHGERL